LCAGRAGFPEILQISRAFFAKKLRHLEAGLARDLALERTQTRKKRCFEVLRFVKPRWQSLRKSCARGAWQISGNFANFSRDFCEKMRHLDAGLARDLAFECTLTRKKSCFEVLRFAKPRWRSSRRFYARGALKFFRDFAIFFRASWAQNLRDPDAGRFLFRI